MKGYILAGHLQTAVDTALEKLKQHLREKQANFVDHNSWFGDTEAGYQTIDTFDLDKLMKEIDEFSKQLKEENRS